VFSDPDGTDPNFLAALPRNVENILTIRGTAIGSAYCEEKIVVWVGAGTRLRIRKYQPDDGQPAFISLEEGTREAYGAAPNTDIGLSAEKMNTNGVLAWFAWYYHTQGITVYGNVRNSTRVEPVLFRNVDIKSRRLDLGKHESEKDRSSAFAWDNSRSCEGAKGSISSYIVCKDGRPGQCPRSAPHFKNRSHSKPNLNVQ